MPSLDSVTAVDDLGPDWSRTYRHGGSGSGEMTLDDDADGRTRMGPSRPNGPS